MWRPLNVRSLCIVAIIFSMVWIYGAPGPLFAGEYPDKPIRMIYPFPAGSGGDIGSRILANAVSKELGKPVKVSNVTGGNGTIGAATVAHARKDGYEIGSLPIGPAVTQPIFSGKLPYSTDDLEPICRVTYLPIVLVAAAHTPYNTIKGLIKYAKGHPGQVVFAHPGLGTVPYMMLKSLEMASGIQLKGIPFKGLSPGVTAVVGGHVDLALAVYAGAIGFQKAGKLKILGLFAAKRMKMAPDIPTVEEDGVKQYPQIWTGVFTPKGLNKNILEKLDHAFAKTVQSRAFLKAMTKAKLPVAYLGRSAFENKIKSDIKYFKEYKARVEK